MRWEYGAAWLVEQSSALVTLELECEYERGERELVNAI
jgi:hypothetical protein